MFPFFRCGIPVVIMGETGCGKTRLIRYMCDFKADGKGNGNLVILKVTVQTAYKTIMYKLHKTLQYQ